MTENAKDAIADMPLTWMPVQGYPHHWTPRGDYKRTVDLSRITAMVNRLLEHWDGKDAV